MNNQYPIERLSDDEVHYHTSVLAQKRAADAVAQSWTAHLAQKYGLATGDSIADDGRIVRSANPWGAMPAEMPNVAGGDGTLTP